MLSTPVIVTGCAGFIGMHICEELLQQGYDVHGVDLPHERLSSIQEDRAQRLLASEKQWNFTFLPLDLSCASEVRKLFKWSGRDCVIIHLAAQTGVRDSFAFPMKYLMNNVIAFQHVLEGAMRNQAKHFFFASSSSVYGNSFLPQSETMQIQRPRSTYAATKQMNEHIAWTYRRELQATALRFFTVYGEWGREDMLLYKVCKALQEDLPIELYAHGENSRDYTHISKLRFLLPHLVRRVEDNLRIPKVLNCGEGRSERTADIVKILSLEFEKLPKLKLMPEQRGDVKETRADTAEVKYHVRPNLWDISDIEQRLKEYAKWFKEYYYGRTEEGVGNEQT